MTFNPLRLTLARKRRGLTKRRLSELVKLTDRSISAYENGEMVPSADTISDLAAALKFPAAFFSGPDLEAPSPYSVSFRALSSMTASQRDAALGAGAIAIAVSKWIDRRFNLPKPELPELRNHSPEVAADALRSHWGLGERPISNLVHLLEAKGVRVFSLAEECLTVDAFSLWREQVPYIFLNTMKSAEHGRFDAAHELGHLVLHGHGLPMGQEAERDADRFASAFLMPRSSILASVSPVTHFTLHSLINLKKVWKVSVAALAHRLRSLDLLTEWHYRTICIQIAQRGFRRSEPEGIARETSQVLQKVMSMLRQDGGSKHTIANDLSILPSELDALIFGFIGTGISGGNKGPRKTSPSGNLRLVRD